MSKRTVEQAATQLLVCDLRRALFLARVTSPSEIQSWSNDEVFTAQSSLVSTQPAAGVALAVPQGVMRADEVGMEEAPKSPPSPVPTRACSQELSRRMDKAE